MAFTSTHTWVPYELVNADDLNDLDSKTVNAVDGVGGGTYSGPINFSNLVGLTVNGATVFNGLVTLNENVTLSSASLFVGAASGIGMQGGSTLSFANTAAASFQNGSTLAQANGSEWTMNGSITVATTGVFFCSSGSEVTFVSTPSFLTGFTVSGGTNSIGGTTNITGALTASGAFTATNTAEFTGATSFTSQTTIVGFANLLRMTGRDVVRKIPVSLAQPDFSWMGDIEPDPGTLVYGWTPDYSVTTGGVKLRDFAAIGAQSLILPLQMPHGSTLKDIDVVWNSSGTTSVTIKIFRSTTELASTTTSSEGTTSFTLAETVDNASHHYRICFTRDSGDDVTWLECAVTCTVDEYTEW